MTIPEIIAAELRSTRLNFTTPVTLASHLHDDLHCSPIDLCCIQVEVETKFGIELPTREVEACATVGDLVALVERVRGRVMA